MTCSKNFGRLLQVGCLGLIGTLTVVGCGGSESKPVADSGTGLGEVGGSTAKPNLNASAATVSVGNVDVGKTSAPVPVIITNTGTAAGALTVTPSGVGIVASGCTGSLAVNTPCTLSITASPSAAGPIVGSVSVAAAGGNTVTIGVSGTASPVGAFTLSPATIALGDVAVGATVQATVTVTANAAITGLTTGVQGADLKVDASSNCTSTLAAGASCNVVVNFSSTTVGSPTSDAVVVGQGGVTKSVPVTANVLAPAKLAATPVAGTLTAVPGSVSTSNLDINVGNIGGMTTGQLVVAFSGTNAADFKVFAETCSIVTLASSKFCTVTVQYAPAATVVAAEAATLTITDKGTGGSVASVALTGIPSLPSTLTLTGSPALGSVAPGASGAEVLFTVTNTSAIPSGALTAVVAPSANITISSNTCATKATLAQNETCTIGLKLTPAAGAAAQAVSASLTVTGATAKAPVSVVVTGAIVSGVNLTATPPSVSFGSIPVNQSSTAQTVTIKNTGATATGALSVTLSGTGAAQVAITGNTCTASLAAAATCTVAVQYSPTDTTGVNGTILVSDGASSVSVPMVGTGLAPSVLTVEPTSADFGSVVIGYSEETVTLTTATAQVLVVKLLSTATTDSGTISTAFAGDNPTDFALSATNSNCTTIQPGQSCTLSVVFTPSAVGARAATLTVSGSKGGKYEVKLKGTALPLVDLQPQTLTQGDPAVDITGLDFGQQPNGTAGSIFKYRAIVRGATLVTATSTVASVVLTTGTTPDFRNVLANGTETATNPCNAATLGLTTKTGAADDTTSVANWTAGTLDDDVPQKVWYCDFYIQFYPQTGKSATAKTATVNASGSAGGTASLSLTGTSSGPLTIFPDKHTFDAIALGGSSQSNTTLTSTVTLTINESDTVFFTVSNKGISGLAQGPLTVALGGTNAADFGIISDECSTADPLTVGGDPCLIGIAFAPTSVGAKTATLTVTATNSGETAVATLTASGAQPYALALAPATGDFGSVAQANVGEWKTFTISNPAGADLTGKLTYEITSDTDEDVDFEIFNLVNSGAGSYPATACGDDNTKQLAGGAACTVQVRFKPINTTAPGTALTPRKASLDVFAGLQPVGSVVLSGIATPQLTLSGAAITLVSGEQTVDFGKAATGQTSTKSVTITNNGAATTAGSVTLAFTPPAGYSIGSISQCSNTGTGATLAGNTSCRLDLTYTGGAPASVATTTSFDIQKSGVATTAVTLHVKSQSVGPAALALSGFGDYVVDDEPTVIDLGAVALGGNTGVLTLWFTNVGGVNATALDSTIVETPTGTEFAVVAENKGTCFSGADLAPEARCSVNVQFKPTTLGDSKTAILSVLANGVPPVEVKLRASAITTASSVYAVVKGTSNSLYTFPGSTSITSATGTKVYYELRNNSGTSLTLTGDTLGPVVLLAGVGRPGDFILTKETDGTGTACGATLASPGFCTFSVTFKPEAWTDTDTLYRWATIANGSAPIAAVIGQVQKPAKLKLSAASTTTITVTDMAVEYGQIFEQATASLTFTITNIGEAATAGAVTATLDSTAQAYATRTTTCGTAALAAGGTCTAVVSVKSTLGRHENGTVKATGTVDAENGDELFTLAVNVVNPANIVLTTPGGTAFANTNAGLTSSALAVHVVNGSEGVDTSENRQDSGVLVVSLSNSTDFTLVAGAGCLVLTSTGTYQLLAGGAACNVSVTFTPKTAGAKTTTVSVGATPGGTTQTVTLTGTALGDLTISPAGTSAVPVALGSGIFAIQNVGSDATGLLRTAIGGTNASLFVVVADSCYGQRLPAGEICTVTVAFLGTSTATAQTATVTVTDGAANNSVTAYTKVVNAS